VQLEEQGELTHLTQEIQRLGKEIDEVFANANNKKRRRYKKILNSDGQLALSMILNLNQLCNIII
jgi:hypothetical protein